jgi:hypothetical protein
MSIPKEKLHRLVDSLPDKKILEAYRLLQSLLNQSSETRKSF